MKIFKSRKTTRLKEYDYSNTGYYYVTICTDNRLEIFGRIEIDKMGVNQYGNIAKSAWLDLPNHHNNVQLDEFIVMPNHVHGIIKIKNPVGAGPARPVNDPTNNNLSVIVGSYKSSVTKQINRVNNNTFKWQRSFYDHIIRTDEALYNIREYIISNPSKWDDDENNIKNYSLKGKAGRAPTGKFG